MMTMKTKLTDALAELSNVWRQQIEVDPTDPYDDGYSTAKHECYESLIDVIREHDCAEIAGALRDAERLDYIERTFSGMTNRERYLPVQMIWGKGANGRTLREACDKYMQRESAMQQGGGGGE